MQIDDARGMKPCLLDLDTEGRSEAQAGRNAGLVHILCYDSRVEACLVLALREEGYGVLTSRDPQQFLDDAGKCAPDLVVLDTRSSAAFVLDTMRRNAWLRSVPAIVVWEGIELDDLVTALKLGAVDAVRAPVEADILVSKVRRVLKHRANAENHGSARPNPIGFSMLTPREREILQFVVDGYATKEVGRKLGISPRTVEVHRARIMAKFRARNVADLTRIALSG